MSGQPGTTLSASAKAWSPSSAQTTPTVSSQPHPSHHNHNNNFHGYNNNNAAGGGSRFPFPGQGVNTFGANMNMNNKNRSGGGSNPFPTHATLNSSQSNFSGYPSQPHQQQPMMHSPFPGVMHGNGQQFRAGSNPPLHLAPSQGPTYRNPNTPPQMPNPPHIPSAIVVLSDGAVAQKKLEVCSLLASNHHYTLLNLDATQATTEDGESSAVSRLQTLKRLLASTLANSSGPFPCKLIITNVVSHSLHEMFVVDEMLRDATIRLAAVVYLDVATANVENVADRIKHPIGFELFSKHYYKFDIGVHVTESDTKTPDSIVHEILNSSAKPMIPRTALSPESRPDPSEVPNVLASATLVTKIDTIAKLQAEVAQRLGISSSCKVDTVTGKVLNYALYNRWAHTLRSYYATKAIDGEAAMLVGLGADAYLLFAQIGALYRVDKLSLPDKLAAELEPSSTAIRWIYAVQVVELDNVSIALVADVLCYHDLVGTQLFTAERLTMLKDVFPLDVSQATAHKPFVMQPYFPISEIRAQSADRLPYQGFKLIKPAPLVPFGKSVDPRNFFLSTDPRLIAVRLWNGKDLPSDEWSFDAFVRRSHLDEDAGAEVCLSEKLIIPNAIVEDQCLNNGNVVVCRLTMVAQLQAPPTVTKGNSAKGKQQQQQQAQQVMVPQLEFVRRKLRTVVPATEAEANLVLQKPEWLKESILTATSQLSFLEVALPDRTSA